MKSPWLRILMVGLLLAWAPGASRADEGAKGTSPKRDIVRAVAESPIDLRQAIERVTQGKAIALRAGFAHDTRGQLMLRVLRRVTPPAEGTFEEWAGPVYDGCWVPRRRTLAKPGERAEATRLHGLLAERSLALAAAVVAARGPQREDKTFPGVVLSIGPAREDGAVQIVSLVARGKQIHRIAQALDSGLVLSDQPTDAVPARIERDPDARADTLPELALYDGIWFHVEAPPTLAGWKGQPVVVAISDPG